MRGKSLIAVAFGVCLSCPARPAPMVARFDTVAGNFDVLLDTSAAPVTVANFAAYADAGAYGSTFFHRSTTYARTNIQIIQGGGFTLQGSSLGAVPTRPPIVLEANRSNLRGTIAMARTTAADSATCQWFFNLTNNVGLNAGPLSAGYAVFGRVMGTGMSVVDAIGAVTVYDASLQLGPVFDELPLLKPSLEPTNLVTVSSVKVRPFAVTNIVRTDQSVRLEWTASTNTPVRIERTTDPGSGPWQAVATGNTAGFFIDSAPPAAAAFYRVVAE